MKTGQMLLLSALLLVAISHAQQDIGTYLQLVASYSSKACQLKYQVCGGLQTSDDYCTIIKNAKQCATTGSVLTNGGIAICTDTEYQRALDVACMSVEQKQKLGELINARRQLSSECESVVSNCFGPLVSPISLNEFCSAIKEADACLLYYVSVRQSCKPKYEEIKALACITGAQNITENVTQNIAQNITENVTHNIAQNITENVTHNIAQNITQNITFLMLACILSLIPSNIILG